MVTNPPTATEEELGHPPTKFTQLPPTQSWEQGAGHTSGCLRINSDKNQCKNLQERGRAKPGGHRFNGFPFLVADEINEGSFGPGSLVSPELSIFAAVKQQQQQQNPLFYMTQAPSAAFVSTQQIPSHHLVYFYKFTFSEFCCFIFFLADIVSKKYFPNTWTNSKLSLPP